MLVSAGTRLFCFVLCLAVTCCPPSSSAWSQPGSRTAAATTEQDEERAWQARPEDLRRALPNNSAPPQRRVPFTQLPPLTSQEEGTIRRVRLPGDLKAVALTFDLCELATVTTGYDADVINFLRREHIPATLFMGGKWMRTHAERAKQLMAEPGFEIGNHAWSHGNFGIMDQQSMRDQALWTQTEYETLREDILRRAEAAGMPAPNMPPVPELFRLPYGRCSDQALTLLARLGLRVIQWDVVAETMADNSRPELAVDVARRVRPGSILLFHANRVPTGTASLLKGVVRELRRKGYHFVTAGTLLALGEPLSTRDGYFNKPGDNKALDARFGVDGTGRRASMHRKTD